MPETDDQVVFYFRNASSTLLRVYNTNEASLARLDELLSTPVGRIDSILITGYASPEGSKWYNRQLAWSRARAVRSCLRWLHPALRQSRLVPVVNETGISPANSTPEELGGAAQQRRAVVSIVWARGAADSTGGVRVPDTQNVEDAAKATGSDSICAAQPRPTADSLVASPMPADQTPDIKMADSGTIDSVGIESALSTTVSSGSRWRDPRFALKTNLLYWAALTPNIEAEWYFARRWSIQVEFQAAWWANRKSHKYFRLMAGGPEVRYWIAHREHFRGHFVSAYAGAGLYEFMGRPNYGLQGEFYIMGGLSYGYSFRIGKRLHMEASIGVGYLQTEYREYHWDAGCYVYDRTKRQSYIGPTKAKLTLTYPLWWLGSKPKGGTR